MPASDDLTRLPMFDPPPRRGVDTGNGGRHGRPAGDGGPQLTEHRPSVPVEPRDYSDLDWGVVLAFREQVANELELAERDRTLDDDQRRDLGRDIISRTIDEHVKVQVQTGTTGGLLSRAEQAHLRQAVFDALFGLGRLQPLIDNDAIENIEVRGYDRVTIVSAGGVITDGPAIADSNEELLEQISWLARRYGVTGRPFGETDPQLDLRLHGGHRLTASAWTTPWPSVVVRRHRIIDVDLADLVELGTLDSSCAAFLAAAVRARRNIVVAGEWNAGKTTLTRALCNEIGRDESLGVVETEFELHLDKLPERHPRVYAWEARVGNGQIGPDGTSAGQITVAQLVYWAHRYNLDRLIVGEVRGGELGAMIEAMESGAGSLSTLHARDPAAAVNKLVRLTLQTSTGGADYAYQSIAEHIDLVVHITKQITTDPDGTRRQLRVVDRVVAIDPGERGWPARTDVYRLHDSVLRPEVPPTWLNDLRTVGYDPAEFLAHTPGALS